jgi:hypothetical protein
MGFDYHLIDTEKWAPIWRPILPPRMRFMYTRPGVIDIQSKLITNQVITPYEESVFREASKDYDDVRDARFRENLPEGGYSTLMNHFYEKGKECAEAFLSSFGRFERLLVKLSLHPRSQAYSAANDSLE